VPQPNYEFSLQDHLCSTRAQLQSKVIVHRDLNIRLRTKIAFRGLDGGVPEQKLDLLQIPAILAAELGAGAAQVMGAEVLDPNLLR
jgi:hypothetical protein